MTSSPALEWTGGLPLPNTMRPGDYGPLLARSPTCEVFALGEDHVVKFYPTSTTAFQITRELELSRRIHAAGLPVPSVLPGLTRNHSDGRIGVVFERIHGKTLTELARRNPFTLAPVAALLAEQHRLVHAWGAIEELPSQKQRLHKHIKEDSWLDAQQKQWLQRVLDGLPDGNQICHGDFAWNNLIVGDQGTKILDWADATIGSALCDVARTWVLISFNHDTSSLAARIYCRALARRYLSSYFGTQPPDASLFPLWKVLNAALRLRDMREESERARIMKFVRAEIARLGPNALPGGNHA